MRRRDRSILAAPVPASFVGLIFAVAGAGHVPAQQVIPDTPACSGCRIEASDTITLGEADGPGIIPQWAQSVTTDARGRFWVLTTRSAPIVFDSTGQFIRVVGRIGDGPGEWFAPRLVLPVGDSVAVWDEGHRRLTIIGPDLTHVRTVALPSVPSYPAVSIESVDWPGLVAISALIRTETAVGWPVHLFDVSVTPAQLIRSFGENNGVVASPPVRPTGPYLLPEHLLLRSLSTAPDRTIWAMPVYGHSIITGWSQAGTLVQAFQRFASWYPERANPLEFSVGSPSTPPTPYIVAVRADSMGHLWVYAQVPARDWEELWTPQMLELARTPPGSGTSGRSVPPGVALRPSPQDSYDTLVEVVDVQRGEVVSTGIVDTNGYLTSVLPDGRLALYYESPLGVPYVKIVSVTLSGGE